MHPEQAGHKSLIKTPRPLQVLTIIRCQPHSIIATYKPLCVTKSSLRPEESSSNLHRILVYTAAISTSVGRSHLRAVCLRGVQGVAMLPQSQLVSLLGGYPVRFP